MSAPIPKKLLQMAGVEDCYTSARGQTATLGNFAKATFEAISKTYSYLSPDLWKVGECGETPYDQHHEFLAKGDKLTMTSSSVPRPPMSSQP